MRSVTLLYKLAIVALLGLQLTGCEVLNASFENDTTRKAEYTWLAMHAVDTMQTVTIARSPECLREANSLAAAIYGSDHPSAGRVVATNLALAFVHAKVGAWLDERTERAMFNDTDTRGGWYMARGMYYVVSFLGTGIAVGGNVTRGVKPLSHMDCGR